MNNDTVRLIVATLALGGIGYLIVETRRIHNSLSGQIKGLHDGVKEQLGCVQDRLGGIKDRRGDMDSLSDRLADIAARLAYIQGFLTGWAWRMREQEMRKSRVRVRLERARGDDRPGSGGSGT